MADSSQAGWAGYLRALMYVLWGIPQVVDRPPRVLIER